MPKEFRMPDIGEGLTEAEILKWFVDVGAAVEVDQILVEVETAKTVVEIPSPFSGTITSIHAHAGETVEVGEILFIVDGDATDTIADPIDDQPAEAKPAKTIVPSPEPIQVQGRPRMMPIVRRLANEKGIDISTIVGSGAGGAITRADVESAPIESASQQDVEPLSRTRQTIADHMAKSWRTIPHVTIQAEMRAEEMMSRRASEAEKPLPLEALVAEATIPLLQTYPEFNSAFVDGGMAVRRHIDLGFAVDTEAGLIVVVVKKADELSTLDLAAEFERLARSAQERTITLAEITDQSFTISNIGALGGGHGTPIIPFGTSSIVSIGRAKKQAVVENGELAIGLVAPIDLSYDHRLIDGALGQRFLSELTTQLETMG
ncbi:MAG: 2-oxo acid dehydrogenase subunit E2 [Actinomycetia bacterium]|nr:2-oxo acid dehydrogenase subunit E2 [Actinomycetes bacterium]